MALTAVYRLDVIEVYEASVAGEDKANLSYIFHFGRSCRRSGRRLRCSRC
jgi:hypothetical protein